MVLVPLPLYRTLPLFTLSDTQRTHLTLEKISDELYNTLNGPGTFQNWIKHLFFRRYSPII